MPSSTVSSPWRVKKKKSPLTTERGSFYLFDEVDGALEEAVEGLAFQHAVLEQGQVDELVDDGVALRIVGDDSGLLVLLCLYGLSASDFWSFSS